MAIIYFLDHPCTPRKELGRNNLAGLFRDFVVCENIVAQLRAEQGELMSEDQMVFTREVQSADGEIKYETLNIPELRQRTAVLEPMAEHCAQCPVSMNGRAFGCVQSVSLPITKEAESWLADRIPAPDTLAGQMMKQATLKMGYGNCETLDVWREGGFIHHPEGFAAPSWNNQEGAPTTNQLLHAMLMVGDIVPTHALAILLFTGSLTTPQGGGGDEVIKRIEALQLDTEDEEPALELQFVHPPEDDDEPIIFEMKFFLMTCFKALTMGIPIAIRPGL